MMQGGNFKSKDLIRVSKAKVIDYFMIISLFGGSGIPVKV